MMSFLDRSKGGKHLLLCIDLCYLFSGFYASSQ